MPPAQKVWGSWSDVGAVKPLRASRDSAVLHPGPEGGTQAGGVHDSWGRPYGQGSKRHETSASPQGPFCLKGSSWPWPTAGPLPLGWWW